MFYGRLKDPDNRDFLRNAIARFRTIFSSVYADDNVILFNRTLRFRGELAPVMKRIARTAQEQSLLLRLNTLAWATTHALHVPGDFVECGVWRGFCSAVLTDYLSFDTIQKSFYLYDTFEGIPSEYDSEGHDDPSLHESGLYDS